jgi:hypothetical protein
MDNKLDKKEQWANDVLHSLDSIKRAEPNTNLFEKISQHLPKEKVITLLPLKHLGWVAAAACFLIAANVYLPRALNSQNTSKAIVNPTALSSDYSIY